MSENRFWLTLWSIAATAVVIIVASSQLYFDNRNTIISKSTDPIAMACALQVDEANMKIICLEKVRKP